MGGSIAVAPAAALELGDVKVHSTLGQPLRASIAYALSPNEQLGDTCVALNPARVSSDLPSVSRGTVRVSDGLITVSGTAPIREPLLSMRIDIDCAYTVRLSREYMLFIDPAGTPVERFPEPVAAAPAASATEAGTASPPARKIPMQRASAPAKPIDSGVRYVVQRGDTLSEIAARIQDRPIGLWAAVDAIFAANPDAFIDNDRDLVKAGSTLIIPDFAAGSEIAVAKQAPPTSVDAPADAEPDGATQVPWVDAGDFASADASASEAVEAVEAVEPEFATIEEDAGEFGFDGAEPFASAEGDNPFVTSDDSVVIPDTDMEIPATSSSPNVPAAVIRTPEKPSAGSSWLLWLGGSGLALIVALLFFGRRSRQEFQPQPIEDVTAAPHRRITDSDDTLEKPAAPLDIELADDSPTEENLALDADLDIGSGLTEGDADVVQNFGFAETTALDIELPDETGIEDLTATNVMPDSFTVEESTLDAIDSDEDDYDISVILDATKMPDPEELTEKDLNAVEVQTGDTSISDDYSITQEIDYELLEKDYEDELSATQALSEEIAQAAIADATQSSRFIDDDKTAELPLASVTELDVTAQAPAMNDDIGADDETTSVEALLEEGTVEMPPPGEEPTAEMPRQVQDADSEHDQDSGKVDSKTG